MIQKSAFKIPIGTIFRLPGISRATFISVNRMHRSDTHEPVDYVCISSGNGNWESGDTGHFSLGDSVLIIEENDGTAIMTTADLQDEILKTINSRMEA